MQNPKYLVTVALPYANGPLHLGHMVEMIEADIWVRTQKMQGADCFFVSGNDAHGTPIMLRAEQEGITPFELVSKIRDSQLKDIASFGIGFDNFSRTDTETNRKICYEIYEGLKQNKMFFEQDSLQAFDEVKQMFLPDRFVKGTCPRCHATEQYGDNCDQCGATYTPADLKDPYSVLTKTKPIFKTSSHLFLDLNKYKNWLEEYIPSVVNQNVASKLNEWFKTDLKPWNITRDEPYHGFEVPDREKQRFYVWFDAPIGYLASFTEAIESKNLKAEDILAQNSDWKMIHFIGKDISYFHNLFWPALLKGSNKKLPSAVHVHGFLTVNGLKMSKSKGTFIEASKLAECIDPELFRYYLCSKLSDSIDDINFDLKEFVEKINSDLVGKFINIISRCSKLLFDHHQGHFHTKADHYEYFNQALALEKEVYEDFSNRMYSVGISKIMKLSSSLNEYLTIVAPWKTLSTVENGDSAWAALTDVLYAFKVIARILTPVMPKLATTLLSYYEYNDAISYDKKDQSLTKPYQAVLVRLDEQKIKEKLMSQQENISVEMNTINTTVAPIKDHISIEDFSKVDLRIATIVSAEAVEGADKLLKLQLDIGSKKIQVFSGIKKHVTPESILGKQVVACVNLQPRQMKFGLSEGMILAASDEQGLCLLSPMNPRIAGATIS